MLPEKPLVNTGNRKLKRITLSEIACPFYNQHLFFCCIRRRFCFRSRHEIVNGLDMCEILIDRFYNIPGDLKPWDRRDRG